MRATGEALGEERRCMFENYCHGVDIEQMKAPFQRSAKEIEEDILFVGRKLLEYRFRRTADGSRHMAPPVACSTLLDIRLNARALLGTLSKCGNLYLSSSLILGRVHIQRPKTQSDIDEIDHRMQTSGARN